MFMGNMKYEYQKEWQIIGVDLCCMYMMYMITQHFVIWRSVGTDHVSPSYTKKQGDAEIILPPQLSITDSLLIN